MRCLLFIVAIMGLPVLLLADAPAGRYTITDGGTAKGTVYDKKTKLTWQQAVSTTRYEWAGAQSYCAQAGTILGGSGWRVPTAKELMSIVDLSRTTSPLIDTTAFPSMPTDYYYYYWSSSPDVASSSYAWCGNFHINGGLYRCSRSSIDLFYVRCVR